MRSPPDGVEPSPIPQPAPSPEQQERTDIGIGRALRLARLRRGFTLDEASRDTHVHRGRLEALEDERFDALGGDVYVRSLLRSYAKYLDLDTDKVIRYFEAMYRKPPPAPAPVEQAPSVGTTEAVKLTGGNRRANWRLAAIVAGAVLVAGAAIGLLSQGTSAPEPVGGIAAPELPAPAPSVEVRIRATAPVRMEVAVDGEEPIRAVLRKGDVRAFDGEDSVRLRLGRGGVAELTVNGIDLGIVGKPDRRFVRTFVPGEDPSNGAGGG